MSVDIDYDPIFNISEADQAVAKLLTPWTPSGASIIISDAYLHTNAKTKAHMRKWTAYAYCKM